MDDFMTDVVNFIKIHEGFRSHIYEDDTGHKTIGFGHNLDSLGIKFSIPISLGDADTVLIQDISRVIAWLSAYPWWLELTNNRKKSLIDLGFNVGIGDFHKFMHMISALTIGDYTEAANQMKSSNWFQEVGERALQDYNLMLNG